MFIKEIAHEHRDGRRDQALDGALTTNTLVTTVWRRGKPRELLHHSDQGSQYTSERFQTLLQEFGITCSMSHRGHGCDNSALESFFSNLNTERVGQTHCRSRNKCRASLFNHGEPLRSVRRRHATIGYGSN
jgi:putative transposase